MGIIKRGAAGYETNVMFFTGTGLVAVITARLLAERSEGIDAGICTLALCLPCWLVFLVWRFLQRDQPQTIQEFVFVAAGEYWWVPQIVLVFVVLTYSEILGVEMGGIVSGFLLILIWRFVRQKSRSGQAD